MKRINLFCLPYAGSSVMVYHRWSEFLDSSIELRLVELSGRGKRFSYPLYESINDAVDDVYSLIKDYLDESPYAFFGHSLGSWIIYELYFKIEELNSRIPSHIFFSGRKPPHIRKDDLIYHKLPDDDFRNEVLKLGGTPIEIFNDPELSDFFLPVLRSDFRILEEYDYIDRNRKINCDITILYGREDNIENNGMNEWRKHTLRGCNIVSFKGGHFFIHDRMKEVVELINNTLISKFRFK